MRCSEMCLPSVAIHRHVSVATETFIRVSHKDKQQYATIAQNVWSSRLRFFSAISSQVFLGHLVSGFSRPSRLRFFSAISSQAFLGHLVSGFSRPYRLRFFSAISSQVFLGFPGSLNKYWDGSRQFQVATTCFSCSPPYLNFKVKSS